MAYGEIPDPLLGKGKRHVTASMSSILGLSKANIVEPEPEIPEVVIPKRKRVVHVQIPLVFWDKEEDSIITVRWGCELSKFGIGKGNIKLTLLATKEKGVYKGMWKVVYVWRWMSPKTGKLTSGYLFSEDVIDKKAAIEEIERLKKKAQLDDYASFLSPDYVDELNELLGDFLQVPSKTYMEIPISYWVKKEDTKKSIIWKAYLSNHGVGSGDITLNISASKSDVTLSGSEIWMLTYSWSWERFGDTTHDYSNHIRKELYNERKEVEKAIETMKSRARIDDYKLFENKDDSLRVEQLLALK